MTKEVLLILLVGVLVYAFAHATVGAIILIIGVFVLLYNLFVANKSDV